VAEKYVPFLPNLESEVPDGYEFSETIQEQVDTSEMISAHAEHIQKKGVRVGRITKDREHKKAEIPVEVPADVPYDWFSYGPRGQVKEVRKKKATAKEIEAARRAKRKYNTEFFVIGASKALYGKKNSRKHKELQERRAERTDDDFDTNE